VALPHEAGENGYAGELKTAQRTIALDATYSIGRNLSGVGIYSRELAAALARAHPETRFLYCYRPHRLLRSFSTQLPPNAGRRLLRGSGPRADLFHGFNQRLDRRYPRAVATFHDLFVMTGEYSTTEFRERFTEQARLAAERADIVIAVSEFTARQVEELLAVKRSRIRVIPHGVQQIEIGEDVRREPLILFVGAIQKRKNITRLIKAFEAAPPGWKLALAGASGFGAVEELGAVQNSPRAPDITVMGYVDDAELDRLYRRASVFAFPSLDEGFGIPVLEAMARGVPVLTSDRSALPEVAGNSALLVDPTSTDAIAAGLQTLIQDEDFRRELSRRGLERSRSYTWDRAAQATWNIYCDLLR
jgi:glycosyltransferase involved in cell wall biosynthesis